MPNESRSTYPMTLRRVARDVRVTPSAATPKLIEVAALDWSFAIMRRLAPRFAEIAGADFDWLAWPGLPDVLRGPSITSHPTPPIILGPSIQLAWNLVLHGGGSRSATVDRQTGGKSPNYDHREQASRSVSHHPTFAQPYRALAHLLSVAEITQRRRQAEKPVQPEKLRLFRWRERGWPPVLCQRELELFLHRSVMQPYRALAYIPRYETSERGVDQRIGTALGAFESHMPSADGFGGRTVPRTGSGPERAIPDGLDAASWSYLRILPPSVVANLIPEQGARRHRHSADGAIEAALARLPMARLARPDGDMSVIARSHRSTTGGGVEITRASDPIGHQPSSTPTEVIEFPRTLLSLKLHSRGQPSGSHRDETAIAQVIGVKTTRSHGDVSMMAGVLGSLRPTHSPLSRAVLLAEIVPQTRGKFHGLGRPSGEIPRPANVISRRFPPTFVELVRSRHTLLTLRHDASGWSSEPRDEVFVTGPSHQSRLDGGRGEMADSGGMRGPVLPRDERAISSAQTATERVVRRSSLRPDTVSIVTTLGPRLAYESAPTPTILADQAIGRRPAAMAEMVLASHRRVEAEPLSAASLPTPRVHARPFPLSVAAPTSSSPWGLVDRQPSQQGFDRAASTPAAPWSQPSPVDINKLTEQVIRAVDDRITAQRERFGRI